MVLVFNIIKLKKNPDQDEVEAILHGLRAKKVLVKFDPK